MAEQTTNIGCIDVCIKSGTFKWTFMTHKASCQDDWLASQSLTPMVAHDKLEALRERRPPWPRQIISLILPTVKMLSLGCERLPTPLKKKKKKKKKGSGSLPSPLSGYATTITVFFCSFTHLAIPRSPPKLI